MDAQLRRRRAQPPGAGPGAPPVWSCRAVHSPPRRLRSQVRSGQSGHGWAGREAGGECPSGQPRPAARGMQLGAGWGHAGMQPVARRGYPGMPPAAVQGCVPVLGGDARPPQPSQDRAEPPAPSRRSRSAAGAGSRPPEHRGPGSGAAPPLQLSPCFCPRARGSAASDVWRYVNTCERRWGLGHG